MNASSSPARYFDAVDWGEMVQKLQENEERLEKMVKGYEDLWKEKEGRREKRMWCMERDLREVKMKEKEFEEKCREKEERSEERMWRMEQDLREMKKKIEDWEWEAEEEWRREKRKKLDRERRERMREEVKEKVWIEEKERAKVRMELAEQGSSKK